MPNDSAESDQKNVVTNQHYIPISLLKNFAIDEQVFEALFEGDNYKIYPTNIDRSMSERFVYEHDDLRGNTIENFFGKKETIIAPKIQDIIRCIDEFKQSKCEYSIIKSQIEELLPIFIIFYYRSGALLKEFSSISRNDKIPLLSKKILNEEYLENLAASIKHSYKFTIIESDDEFLLSDQFVSTAALSIKSNFFDISNRHIGIRDTLVMIPLSSKYYAIYWHSDRNILSLDENMVNILSNALLMQFNQTIINNSYYKCISKKKISLENVIGKYEMAYPSQAYMGYSSGFTTGVIRKKEVFFDEIDKDAFEMMFHMRFFDYQKIGRNHVCLCGSNKKFKYCHLDAFNRLKPIILRMRQPNKPPSSSFTVPGMYVTELPIDEWGGFSEKLKAVREKRKS
ncbi:DUF4238 domain-containing protein [Patescibacteria group bacterium]|nr:DUF4238 domain-containing protein [Patescibacteria group bacterium]